MGWIRIAKPVPTNPGKTLAIDPITQSGPTEGHLVVDQYLQAAASLPGLVGYAYDRALRGTHLDRLLKAPQRCRSTRLDTS